jgi:hypothetical protein
MKQGTFITVLVVAAGLVAANAAPANVSIGTAVGERGAQASALQLGFKGSPDPDEISVALDGTGTQYVITSTRPINPPPPPCVQITTFQISCPTSDFVAFSVALGDGNDQFAVGPSVTVPVSMSGGDGSDLLRGGSGPDTLTGGDGPDRLLGNNGDDKLKGGRARDVLKGGKGRDVLDGGKGGDRLFGGPGRDVEKQ